MRGLLDRLSVLKYRRDRVLLIGMGSADSTYTVCDKEGRWSKQSIALSLSAKRNCRATQTVA